MAGSLFFLYMNSMISRVNRSESRASFKRRSSMAQVSFCSTLYLAGIQTEVSVLTQPAQPAAVADGARPGGDMMVICA